MHYLYKKNEILTLSSHFVHIVTTWCTGGYSFLSFWCNQWKKITWIWRPCRFSVISLNYYHMKIIDHSVIALLYEQLSHCNYVAALYVTYEVTNQWWRYDMEAFSASPALCVGHPLVANGFPAQGTSNGELVLCLYCSANWALGQTD